MRRELAGRRGSDRPDALEKKLGRRGRVGRDGWGWTFGRRYEWRFQGAALAGSCGSLRKVLQHFFFLDHPINANAQDLGVWHEEPAALVCRPAEPPAE